MYCSVARSFHNEVAPTKRAYVYKCDAIKNLKRGDVVEVETKYGIKYGVVSRVFEEDLYNFRGLFRTNVVKKVHTNTVKAAIRRRFEEYKDIKVYTEFKKGRLADQSLKQYFGENYHYKMLKALCLGSILDVKEDKRWIHICYKNFIFIVRKYKEPGMGYALNGLRILDVEKKWITPIKAKEEFNKLYAATFGE